MVKFGPSGNDEAFYNEGNKSSLQAPRWLNAKGLELFEYPFGRGVNMSEQTALSIGAEGKKWGIEISVHAPYFINFATVEEEKAISSYNYILQSAEICRKLGGNRVIFHPGSPMKLTREQAMERILERLRVLCGLMDENGYVDIILCPETMGKKNQMGTLNEVIDMCKVDGRYYPCVDFGHINAREGGILKTSDDYRKLIDALYNGVGAERTQNMHVHFSKIQYSDKGEIRHLTFADEIYGPCFDPLSVVLHETESKAHVICESAGTQSDDALTMQRIYKGE